MKTKSILIFFMFLLLLCESTLRAQWSPTTMPPNNGHCFANLGSNIFAGDFHNIYMSTNNGTNWSSVLNNPNLFDPLSLVINGTDLFAGVIGGGVFRSTNNGANWTTLNSGLTNNNVYALAIKDSFMFAGTGNNGGVFVSSNFGTSWSSSAGSPPNVYSLVIIGTKLIAGSVCGVFITTNNGVSWDLSSSGLPACSSVRALTVIDSTIYAGLVSGGAVYLSTDNGANWLAANTGISSYNVLGITGLGSNIFASTPSAGVFMSTNSGTTWNAINDGLPGNSMFGIKIIGSYLYAGCQLNQGVWKRPLSELITGAGQEISEIPGGFKLEQNYPNPFNPSTTIRYSLPKSSYVSLRIYDVQGLEVKTLFSGYRTAGNYSVIFDASNFSSGVYFYEISAGEFTDAKSMVLIK